MLIPARTERTALRILAERAELKERGNRGRGRQPSRRGAREMEVATTGRREIVFAGSLSPDLLGSPSVGCIDIGLFYIITIS